MTTRSEVALADVARLAGESRATVSRVINSAPGVSEEQRARVSEAVAALYAARDLARSRQGVDVIALTDSSGIGWTDRLQYSARVEAGMEPILDGANARPRWHELRYDTAEEAIDKIEANMTLGVVLADVPPTLATRFHRQCRLTVSLVPTAAVVPAMLADNIGGAFTAVTELYRLGRRRIAAIHGPATDPCAVDRRIGQLRAVRELGLADIGADGGFTRKGGYHAALQLLQQHPGIDALFIASDVMAGGAVQAITVTGRRVPQDVSIIGFDDSIAAVRTNPPLTTMRLPVEDMAAAATRLLLDGDATSGYRQIFPVDLIWRDSA